MKRIVFLSGTAALLVGLAACREERVTRYEVSTDDGTLSFRVKERTDLQDAFERRIDQVGRRLDELRGRARRSDADRDRFDRLADDLSVKRDRLAEDLRRLRLAAQDSWDEFRVRLADALDDVEHALRDALD
jgi:LPS O-antigen subunit length determinant protein (WzzB/FepE family)